jgi:divalent metal cation (Fe/Co/Zn/Cd) transporter
MVVQAEVHIEVDGNKPLSDVELLSSKIEMEIHSKLPTIHRISVIPHPFRPVSNSSSTTFLKSHLSQKFSGGIHINKK